MRMRATPRSLTPNKDIQDLIRLAYEQDWNVVKMANNHLRWFPPKGPFVHTSCTPGGHMAIKKIRSDLKRAGLTLPHMEFWADEEKSMSKDDDSADHLAERANQLFQKVVPSVPVPDPPAPKPEPSPTAVRKGVMDALRTLFELNPNSAMSVALVAERLQSKYPGIKPRDIYSHLSVLNNRGFIQSAPGRGMYILGSSERPSATPAGPKFVAHAIIDKPAEPKTNGAHPPEESGALDEDNEFLERFMAFMMEMEAWIRKQQRRSQAYNKLKKMLEGVDIDG